MRILLVEDNRDILANLADYLGMKGYTVDCAQDGLSGSATTVQGLYGTLVIRADGSYTYTPNGSPSSVGKVDVFSYQLVHANGLSDSANLYVRIDSPQATEVWSDINYGAPETVFNPNAVKVVSDKNGLALTFSRAPLPWARDAFAKDRNVLAQGVPYRRHIGMYAYRVGFLQDFVGWGPCWLEQTEALEQLRALWHGVRIHVEDAIEAPAVGVDTPEDLERVRRLLEA